MSEAELIELEDRARQGGCFVSFPFESRSPFAPTNTSISYTTTSFPSYSPVMISSSHVPVTGSKYFHSDCHEDDVDEIQRSPRRGIICRDTTEIKNVFHQCAGQFDESPRCGSKGRDTLGGADQVFHGMAEQVDDRDVHGARGEDKCIGEVTKEDMLQKLFEHEEHGHEED